MATLIPGARDLRFTVARSTPVANRRAMMVNSNSNATAALLFENC